VSDSCHTHRQHQQTSFEVRAVKDEWDIRQSTAATMNSMVARGVIADPQVNLDTETFATPKQRRGKARTASLYKSFGYFAILLGVIALTSYHSALNVSQQQHILAPIINDDADTSKRPRLSQSSKDEVPYLHVRERWTSSQRLLQHRNDVSSGATTTDFVKLSETRPLLSSLSLASSTAPKGRMPLRNGPPSNTTNSLIRPRAFRAVSSLPCVLEPESMPMAKRKNRSSQSQQHAPDQTTTEVELPWYHPQLQKKVVTTTGLFFLKLCKTARYVKLENGWLVPSHLSLPFVFRTVVQFNWCQRSFTNCSQSCCPSSNG
jgi:hypothetical protein